MADNNGYETLGQLLIDLKNLSPSLSLQRIMERIRQTQRDGKDISQTSRGFQVKVHK